MAATLQKVKDAINKVMPTSKKRTALEEAQWEDDNEESALEREMMMQCKIKPQLFRISYPDLDDAAMETLRVHRPRLVVYGQPGMGQGYIGAAALHYLEGYHIQTLDLGTLMGDSTRVGFLNPVRMTVISLELCLRPLRRQSYSYSLRPKDISHP